MLRRVEDAFEELVEGYDFSSHSMDYDTGGTELVLQAETVDGKQYTTVAAPQFPTSYNHSGETDESGEAELADARIGEDPIVHTDVAPDNMEIHLATTVDRGKDEHGYRITNTAQWSARSPDSDRIQQALERMYGFTSDYDVI